MSQRNGKSILTLVMIIAAVGAGLGITNMVIGGPMGPQGIPGEDGISGTDGVDGMDGINGTDGIAGEDGIDGEDGINGIDGEDAPGYFCATEQEVQSAITAIGSSVGRIILTADIDLSTNIYFVGGGHYTVEGDGMVCVKSDTGNAFSISSVQSCVLQNFILDISDQESIAYGILIGPGASQITIKSLYIISDGGGTGIGCSAPDSLIEDNKFSNVETGVEVFCADVIIRNNIFEQCSTGVTANHQGNSVLISNNIFNEIDIAITLESCTNAVITNNFIQYILYTAVDLYYVSDALITGNIFQFDNNIVDSNAYAFFLQYSTDCIIASNTFRELSASGTGTCYVFFFVFTDNNLVTDNLSYQNDVFSLEYIAGSIPNQIVDNHIY